MRYTKHHSFASEGFSQDISTILLLPCSYDYSSSQSFLP